MQSKEILSEALKEQFHERPVRYLEQIYFNETLKISYRALEDVAKPWTVSRSTFSRAKIKIVSVRKCLDVYRSVSGEEQ